MNHLGDNIITFLKDATTKIESLQVQTSLGKAEFSDKLEEIKNQTKNKINHLKWDANSAIEDGKDTFNHFKSKMEHLNLQLALAKAETAEEYNEQKKKITEAMRDLKHLFLKD